MADEPQTPKTTKTTKKTSDTLTKRDIEKLSNSSKKIIEDTKKLKASTKADIKDIKDNVNATLKSLKSSTKGEVTLIRKSIDDIIKQFRQSAKSDTTVLRRNIDLILKESIEFKRISNQNNWNMKSILKDIYSVFDDQKYALENLADRITDTIKENKGNRGDNFTMANGILRESLSIQRMMLQELKKINGNISSSSRSSSENDGTNVNIGGDTENKKRKSRTPKGTTPPSVVTPETPPGNTKPKGFWGKTVGAVQGMVGAYRNLSVNQQMGILTGAVVGTYVAPEAIEGVAGLAGLGYGAVTAPNQNGSSAEAMNFFRSKGWSKEQAAGIVGNLSVESGNFSKDVISGKRKGDNGLAVGVAQWHPDRQNKFKSLYGKKLEESTFKEQLEFVDWELNNTHKSAGNLLRNAEDVTTAAHIVQAKYEISVPQSLPQRIAVAKSLAASSNTSENTSSSNIMERLTVTNDTPPVHTSPVTNNTSSTPNTSSSYGKIKLSGDSISSEQPSENIPNPVVPTIPSNTSSNNVSPSSSPMSSTTPSNNSMMGETGSENARNILSQNTNKDISHIEGLNSGFASSLSRFFTEAKEQGLGISITSGYRSPERQAQLFNEAVKKYGSVQAARKWVAPPGKSNHNRGLAADLGFSSEKAKQWAHQNASRFGLSFRMGHEPWHIEPSSAPSDTSSTQFATSSNMSSGGISQVPNESFNQSRNIGMQSSPLETLGGIIGGSKGAMMGGLIGTGINLISGMMGSSSENSNNGEQLNSYGVQDEVVRKLANEKQIQNNDTRNNTIENPKPENYSNASDMDQSTSRFFGNEFSPSWYQDLKAAFPQDMKFIKFT